LSYSVNAPVSVVEHFSIGDVDAFGGNVEPDKMQGWMDRKWTFGVGRLARMDRQTEPCLAMAHNGATGGRTVAGRPGNL
jgi:hypothetical protein